jgi:predicted dehydrogenase
MKPTHALVLGVGSIGRRHCANLRALGVGRIDVFDPAPERCRPVVEELGATAHADFEGALAAGPDVVLVCTPPVLHVEQARAALKAGCHVFVEKPVSHSLEGVAELEALARQGRRVVQVGYNLRFHPGLRVLKRLLDEGALGRPLWVQAEAAQYLPDWRPWQDYRASYTARRCLGGGILLDGSHEIDYLTWLLGRPDEVLCMAGRVSDLEVDVEDCATLLLRFPPRTMASVHLDFVQRGPARWCKIAGERGTAHWNFFAQEVRLTLAEPTRSQSLPYAFDVNEMYVAELRHFLACVAGEAEPEVTIEQARDVLELILRAKRQTSTQA